MSAELKEHLYGTVDLRFPYVKELLLVAYSFQKKGEVMPEMMPERAVDGGLEGKSHLFFYLDDLVVSGLLSPANCSQTYYTLTPTGLELARKISEEQL